MCCRRTRPPATVNIAGGALVTQARFFALLLVLCAVTAGRAGADADNGDDRTLVRRLLDMYAQIESVSCEIAKTTRADGRTVRMLSRVHFKAPASVHIENVSPTRRTIISNGTLFHYYEDRLPRGFARPVTELPETWRQPLQNIPGTAVEHILRLEAEHETELPPDETYPVVRAYETETRYVILFADGQDRLHKIIVYDRADLETPLGEHRFSHFEESIPGCWIPLRHAATLFGPDGDSVVETRRISRMTVNAPMPEGLFDYRIYLPHVRFTDDFEKTRIP